jgi:hypothetical protein
MQESHVYLKIKKGNISIWNTVKNISEVPKNPIYEQLDYIWHDKMLPREFLVN